MHFLLYHPEFITRIHFFSSYESTLSFVSNVSCVFRLLVSNVSNVSNVSFVFAFVADVCANLHLRYHKTFSLKHNRILIIKRLSNL